MNRSIAPPLHAPYRYSAIEPIVGPRDLTLLRVFDRLRSEDVALCTMARQQGVDVQSAAAEFAKLGSIDHPLLARVRDFGATDELVFYSRELGLPTTLQNLSAAELDEGTLYSLLLAASEGMEALHEAGLVHGLVLPEHVQVSMVDGAFGGMRLADAGLRRLLPSSSLKRRERYDPPEMRKGADVSPGSDIYQLGTTLLEVLGGGSPSGAISRGAVRRSSLTAGGTDKNLRDLLGRLVDPDPHRRYASGRELRRSLSAMDWALPDRTADVSSLVTPLMVGREREMGHLVAALKRAVAAEVHAVEVVGPGGMGRTRVLRELAVRAGEEGWNAVLVGGRAGEKAIEDALSSKREAKSLLLVDNADQLHPDVLAQLRFLVAEAGTSPVLVVSTAVTAVGLPGADVIALDPLGVRDLKRLIEPLLLSALNPEVALQAVDASAAGNPLWVKLLLASWRETGRLRFVHGRPFFDERPEAGVPDSIAGIVFRIVDGMSRSERDLVEAMAIWGAPLPMAVAKRVLSDNPEVASALVRTDGGDYRFIGDTVGPVVVGLLSQERQRHWHSAFLSVLAEDELGGRQRALHLLGAGRSAEAIRALVDEGIAAEKRRDYRVAFMSLRDAFERYPSDDVQGIERARLALDAARLATLVGEPHWARVVLESTRPESADPPSLRLEHMVLQANVLRELRDAAGAAALYVQAKELIARHPGLQDQVIPVQLEETANDAMRGEGQKAIRQVEAIVKSVEAEKPTPLLGLALQRAGSLYARLGRPRASLVYELRSLRTARRLGDHQLAARALVNLGHLYWVLGRPRRALLALRQVENELASCPHDGIAASELMNRADVFMGTGRSDEAYTLLLHARALRERAGERGRLATTLILLGSLSQHGGRLADGARYYREAIALAEEFELPVVRAAQSNLGELHLQMGAWDEAERLLRIGLSNPKPDQRGLTLVNLGRLRREQGRYQDALQFLAEAEQLLAGFSRRYRAYAVLETARVLFAAGDVEGASFHLLQVRDDVASDQELRIGYQVLDGLIASVRGEEAERGFRAALSALQESQDPTLVAEALIAILERALASSEMNPAWFAHQLELLENAASRTDARQLMMQARVIRARFAERCAASSDDRGLAEKLRQSVEQGTSGVEAAIGELLRDLPGAAGAAVFVVGVDGQGRPMVSALPKSSKAPDTRIRPYRVAVREFDRDLFRRALGASGGNVHEAARKLRLPTSTFRYRAIKLGLLNPTPREK